MTQTALALNSGAPGHGSVPVLLLRNIKDLGGDVQRFPLEKFRLSIGRAPEDDISLAEGTGVSRNHASVFVLDGEVVIEDLGSRNGTYVNRKLIRGSRQTTVKFGDVIAIGRYRLKLVDEADTQDANDASEIQGLLLSWGGAVNAHDVQQCVLCNEPRPASASVEPPEVTSTPAIEETAEIEVTAMLPADAPTHGRIYGRKLPRRSLLQRRVGPTKRSALSHVKRVAASAQQMSR
ncbi:MAG: FHA domain-containing protein [Gammaproteobacteria bacterium]